MKTLSKTIEERRLELIDLLTKRESDLESAISRFNAIIDDAKAEIEAAVADYNETVREAHDLREEAQDAVQTYYDERPEKWQESEKGREYQSWIDNLCDLELNEIEVELPDAVELPEFDACAALEQNWQSEP